MIGIAYTHRVATLYGKSRRMSRLFTKKRSFTNRIWGKYKTNNGLHIWHKKCFVHSENRLHGDLPCPVSPEEVATMNAKKGFSTKAGLLTAAAVLAISLVPYANATPVHIGFNGAGGSGHASLTVGSDTIAGDPTGAQVITGATGTFSDANIGINNVSITGVLARNFATPDDMKPGGTWQPGDVPFPASFSELAVTNPPPGDTAITYSDLFYANGSPQSCWDYPFAGGFLDTYGVMFTLGNGSFVDLWSDGITAPMAFGPTWPGGLTYGFAVIDNSLTVTDFQFLGVNAAVPEPNFLWVFGAGVLGLFMWRRSRESRRTRWGR